VLLYYHFGDNTLLVQYYIIIGMTVKSTQSRQSKYKTRVGYIFTTEITPAWWGSGFLSCLNDIEMRGIGS
jgi:hypothetical protein